MTISFTRGRNADLEASMNTITTCKHCDQPIKIAKPSVGIYVHIATSVIWCHPDDKNDERCADPDREDG